MLIDFLIVDGFLLFQLCWKDEGTILHHVGGSVQAVEPGYRSHLTRDIPLIRPANLDPSSKHFTLIIIHMKLLDVLTESSF